MNNDFNLVYDFAIIWVNEQKRPFTSEELRNALYEAKEVLPRNLRTFGNVFNSLESKGIIFKTDRFIPAKIKESHGCPKRLWISREYRKQQQENRLNPYKDQVRMF